MIHEAPTTSAPHISSQAPQPTSQPTLSQQTLSHQTPSHTSSRAPAITPPPAYAYAPSSLLADDDGSDGSDSDNEEWEAYTKLRDQRREEDIRRIKEERRKNEKKRFTVLTEEEMYALYQKKTQEIPLTWTDVQAGEEADSPAFLPVNMDRSDVNLISASKLGT